MLSEPIREHKCMKVTVITCFSTPTDDDVIQGFLWMDACHKVADKVRYVTVQMEFHIHYTYTG